MDKVRIGVIGLGNMGIAHADYLHKGEVSNAVLTAVFDINPERLETVREKMGDAVAYFDDVEKLLSSNLIDAVVIATPHYSHPELAMKAFKNGLHVMIEKPAGVYTGQVREMNEAAQTSGRVFSIMYNQRTNPLYSKLRDLVQSGELGEIRRTNWIVTNWYRSQAYFNSGGWRATWAGEGGGVLINQCPHNLDLWQWTCGMPERIRAFCGFGKYHDIEVEDDVTAYVEYPNGATGVFITCTADAPGTNRYEVTGDRGKIVIENDQMTFWRLTESERVFNQRNTVPFGRPEAWKCEIPINSVQTAHRGIMQNWVDAVFKGSSLIAPGIEGINGLQISNAIHLSSWLDDWVKLPVDEKLYMEKLQERIQASKTKKNVTEKVTNVNGTF